MDVELAVTESQRPVLPLPLEGDGDESGDGLCWFIHWATAKPAKQDNEVYELIISLKELTHMNTLRMGKSDYCIKVMLISCSDPEDALSLIFTSEAWKSECILLKTCYL